MKVYVIIRVDLISGQFGVYKVFENEKDAIAEIHASQVNYFKYYIPMDVE